MEVLIQVVNGGLTRILDDILDLLADPAKAGMLGGSHLGLFQTGTPAFDEEMVLGDVVECTYDGYARQPLVWGNQGVDPNGRQSVHAGGLLFSPTGAVTPNTVTGIFLATALVAGTLLGVGYFAEGISFNGIEDDLSIVSVFAVPLAGNWGKFVTAQ